MAPEGRLRGCLKPRRAQLLFQAGRVLEMFLEGLLLITFAGERNNANTTDDTPREALPSVTVHLIPTRQPASREIPS